MKHGLFEVVPGVYQVRGLDIANMTLIEGDTGVIVVDTLTSIEGARAAMELYFQHRGKRPVAAVIFTHTHTDHWGGARGVLDDDALAERPRADHRAQSFHGARGLGKHHRRAGDAAPRAISVRAVPRQGRARAGRLRARQVDGGGLGGAVAPDRSHHRDRRQAHHRRARIRIPDGAEQRGAGGDAFLSSPRYKLLNLAENCTHNFHNLLPFRGADVRDALAWSKYLGEALQMWGGKADAMCGQHHWPVWGTERIDTMIRQQRDLYKFAHDQTIRLMNHGLTATEIAETIKLPASLDGAWHAPRLLRPHPA